MRSKISPILLAWTLALATAGVPPSQATAETPLPPAQSCPQSAVPIPLGTDIAAASRAANEGTQFCLAPGEHRLQTINPKNGQAFYGEPGAILNGARQVTGFQRKGPYWKAGGQSQHGYERNDVPCIPARPRCTHPDAVFLDNVPLLHAASVQQLAKGMFYLDYTTNELYLADDPTGHKLEASVSPYAFASTARHVTIKGLIVEKYASPAQAGAIGSNIAPAEWTIDDNEVKLNASLGITAGDRSQVTHNRIHDNGQMGLGCVGNDIRIEQNDISRNGYFSGVDPLWEGGGAKCAKTSGLIVRSNHVTQNNGNGFWTDIDNIATLYEANMFDHNVNSGVSHEISYAATIRNNTFIGNGDGFHVWLWGGAIQIQNSRDVEVFGNAVYADRGNGIVLIQQDRGTGAYGPRQTLDNNIHDNLIVSTTPDYGASGAVADFDKAVMRAGHNRFARNTYQVRDQDKDRWAWIDGFYSWPDYRARSGQDADSTLSQSPPNESQASSTPWR